MERLYYPGDDASEEAFERYLEYVRAVDFDHTIDDLGDVCMALEGMKGKPYRAGRLYAILLFHREALEVPEYLPQEEWVEFLENHVEARDGFRREANAAELAERSHPRWGPHDLSRIAAVLSR